MRPNSISYAFIYALWATLALTLFSGVFLMVYYIPTFAQAFSSVERLNEQIPFGWLVRRAHGVGGNFLLLLMFLHLLQVFYQGAYKINARAGWPVGIISLFLIVGTNFSGFFLPLSQFAFWGTATVLSSLSSLPWIGSFLVDFLRGGKELGGAALVRFYSMHIGFSALIALLFFGYDRLYFPKRKLAEEQAQKFKGFLLATASIGLILAAVTFVPHWFCDPLQEAANPLVNPERLSPPWYFLFLEETLKFLSGAYPTWTLLAMVLVPLLLLLVPYLDRNPHCSIQQRPFALGLGAAFFIAVVYFSLIGTANARFGEKIILPDRPLSSAELRGARVFAEKKCAYCHQVFGQEGRREGPDMAVVGQRHRSPEWIQRFVLNARIYQPGTTMPRYEIPLEDLEALGAYLLSLDSRNKKFKAVDHQLFRDYGPYLQGQKEEKK